MLILGCGSGGSLVIGGRMVHSLGKSSRKAESRLGGDHSNLSEGYCAGIISMLGSPVLLARRNPVPRRPSPRGLSKILWGRKCVCCFLYTLSIVFSTCSWFSAGPVEVTIPEWDRNSIFLQFFYSQRHPHRRKGQSRIYPGPPPWWQFTCLALPPPFFFPSTPLFLIPPWSHEPTKGWSWMFDGGGLTAGVRVQTERCPPLAVCMLISICVPPLNRVPFFR